MSIRHRENRVSLTPGFLLLAALLLYLDDGAGIFQWVVLSALLHEGGHVGMAVLFGGKVEALTLTVMGAELRFSFPKLQPYWMENMIALAGPAVNLLVGCVFLWLGGTLAGIMSLCLGLFNLLPVLPLDGGRVLFNLAAEFLGLSMAEQILTVSAAVCAGVMAGLGVVAVVEYANFTILLGAIWLLWGALKKQSRFPPKS